MAPCKYGSETGTDESITYCMKVPMKPENEVHIGTTHQGQVKPYKYRSLMSDLSA